ncbi:MAG: 2-methylaconitate cis-trans isomerase PrpF family protein [Desulfocapsaceae bacterium]
MQIKIPGVIMRGGTSRALFFKEDDLPKDKREWESLFLSALGSPDATGRQIDGLGGGVSSNSKVAVISPSDDPRYDVVYYFGQVAVDKPSVDFIGNCGNISSAVAPFAIDEGLVSAVEPYTTVRIHQQNTDKIIIAKVRVDNGKFQESGDYAIPGINGTGSRITLQFVDPGGSLTGKLLPTGKALDILQDVGDLGDIECSIVDAGNPLIFIAADQLGIDTCDLSQFEVERIAGGLESIRARAAVVLGFAENEQQASIISQAVPKIAVVSAPQSYTAMGGETIESSDMDVLIRCLSMGALHKALPGTAAISAAGAAKLSGSVVNRVLADNGPTGEILRFGHPTGVMEAGSTIEGRGISLHYQEATLFRTARRIMEGKVLVPRPI